MRLLASMLLALLALFACVDLARLHTTPGYRVIWQGYAAFGIAYLLSRTALRRLAVVFSIGLMPALIFSFILTNPGYGLARTVYYLVLSIVFASVVAPWPAVVALAGANSLALLLLPALRPGAVPSYDQIVTPAAVNLIGAALVVISMRHRAKIEARRQAELQASKDRLQLALSAAEMGLWEWDATTDTVRGLARVAELLGQPGGPFVVSRTAFLERLHPDDRAAFAQGLARARSSPESDYCGELRVLWPDGGIRRVRVNGRLSAVRIGAPPMVMGTMADISAVASRRPEHDPT